MAVFNVKDLLASLSGDQRVIGIDPGSKTIGLALSDVRRRLASPYGSLKRGKVYHYATRFAGTLTFGTRPERNTPESAERAGSASNMPRC